jgi:hypothetical protein
MEIGLQRHIVFILHELSNHALESYIDNVLLRYTHNEPEPLKVEDDIECFFIFFKYFNSFVEEVIEFENSIFLIIHMLHKSFDECAQLFPRIDSVALIHKMRYNI